MDAKEQRIAQLEAENAALRETVQELKQTIVVLQEKISRLEKDSGNSSKPPSSDIVKPKKKPRKRSRKKRNKGGQHGHHKFSRTPFKPEEIDGIIEYTFKSKDAVGFIAGHTSKTLVRWANDLLEWLKKLFDTLNRSHELTDRYFAKKIEEIKTGFLKRMRRPPGHELAENLARRFKGKAAENYFRFMTDPDIEPTNNGTEREIRHTVIDRRITQGTRGRPGMQWCRRIWTTIATCKKQNRNIFEFIHNSLLAHWTNTCCPELV